MGKSGGRWWKAAIGCAVAAGMLVAAAEKTGRGKETVVVSGVRRVDLGGGAMLEMAPVPAGSFLMGSKNGGRSEEPVHEVHLRAFWMSRTEISQKQYRAVTGVNPSSEKGDLLPVTNVSWHDAVAFCRRLTERERKAGRLPEGFVYTLPSEAQWEYACRAGTTGAFAGDLEALGWYAANSGGRVQPVGRKQPNRWGLYDMHGNVWEWCYDDWHPDYCGAPADGRPWGGGYGRDRVLRGGAWFKEAIYCRSSTRFHRLAADKSRSTGFRIVLCRQWR